MMSFVQIVASLLDKLLSLFIAQQRVSEAGRAQDEREKLESHPSGWFDKHFSGKLPVQPSTPPSTDKANPSDNRTG